MGKARLAGTRIFTWLMHNGHYTLCGLVSRLLYLWDTARYRRAGK